MQFENLIYDREDFIVTLTVNRPEVLNALNEKTLTELEQLCRAHEMALVLATEPLTDPALVEVLERFAGEFGVAVVRNVIDETGAARVEELVEVVSARL